MKIGIIGAENSHTAAIAKTFTAMFKTGREPLTREQMLKPVQVLEALERSVKFGTIEKVSK